MIKWLLIAIGWLAWGPIKKKPAPVIEDAEFDIEGRDVIAIERKDSRSSNIHWMNQNYKDKDYNLPCTLEKHKQLLSRFREKLKLHA